MTFTETRMVQVAMEEMRNIPAEEWLPYGQNKTYAIRWAAANGNRDFADEEDLRAAAMEVVNFCREKRAKEKKAMGDLFAKIMADKAAKKEA